MTTFKIVFTFDVFFSAETTCTARWHVFYIRNRHISVSSLVYKYDQWPHDRKSRCLKGRRHSSILYSPSGFFSTYFINEVNFYHYKKYGSVGTVGSLFLVFKSNLEHFWQMSRWSSVYVPEIETGRHIKNNACTVEIKIKWMIRKHIPWRYLPLWWKAQNNNNKNSTEIQIAARLPIYSNTSQALVSGIKKNIPIPIFFFTRNKCLCNTSYKTRE